MRKSIGKNYIFNIAYEVVALLTPLITTPYISRVLGAEGIGIFSLTHTNACYFMYFATLGTTIYARRETAYKQDNLEERSKLFWEIVLLRFVMTLLCMIAYAVYVIGFDNNIIAWLQSLVVLAVIFDITWFFQGMENFTSVALRNIIIKLIGVVFVFLFVKTSDDLWLYVLGVVGFPVIGNILLWIGIRKEIKFVKLQMLRPARHIKGSFALFIPAIAAQVYLMLDKTMIGYFTVDNVENGYYEQAQKLIRICWTLVTTFATVMSPRIAFVFAKNNKKELQNYMRNSFRFIWMSSLPIACGVFAVSDNLVPWFFGEEFESVKLLLKIFSWIVIPIGLTAVTGSQYLITTKRLKWYTGSIIIAACINMALNMFMIPRLFSTGAAIASVIAEIVVAAVQIIYITCVLKEFGIGDIVYNSWRYVVASAAMFSLLLIMSMYLTPSAIHSFIMIGSGTVIYMGLLLITRDDLALSIVHKIILRFKNK